MSKCCCNNCLYKDKYNRCTVNPISSEYEIKYIPDSLIDDYICRYYKKRSSNKDILNEKRGING